MIYDNLKSKIKMATSKVESDLPVIYINSVPSNFTGIVVYPDRKEWLLKGKYHRLDGPAIEYPDGSKFWFVKGKNHRLDGPAVEYADGSKYWFVKGKQHRLDGPAIEYSDGSKYWYVEDKRHRLDGPACEWADGSKEWYVEDKRHRLDGPAIEYADGSKSWYVEDKELTFEQFWERQKDTEYAPKIMAYMLGANPIYKGDQNDQE